MLYLESKRYIIHRDIAARNCVVDDVLTTKIADFGMARYVTENTYQGSRKERIDVKRAAPEV